MDFTRARPSLAGDAPRRMWRALVVCVLTGLMQHSIAAAAPPDDPSSRDLQRLVAWFGGEFDNQEQIWFETEGRAATPVAERHERVHAVHRRVSLPTFGKHVFYVEEYLDDDPQKVFRQRLVTFESARQSGVRMKLWFFKDPGKVRGAQLDPSKLAGITREDVTDIEGCDVFWVLEGDQYVGGMKPRACVFGDAGERRYSQHDLVLSATKYWRVDRIFALESERLVSGHSAGVPHKLVRAKIFSCDVSFYAGNYLAGPNPNDQIAEDQIIHSQGGTITIHRRSDDADYTLRLRDKEYPYFEQNPDFMFLSVRKGKEPFIAYSLHDPEAALIGFNLGWMSVFCERTDPPRL